MDNINKIALIGAFRALGGSLIWPFIGYALYTVYKLPLTVVSLFYLLQGVIGLGAYYVGGILTDTLGRRKGMYLAITMASISIMMASQIASAILVSTLILAQTFFNDIYFVASTSIVGDIFEDDLDSLIRAFSRQRVGINAGWAIGPLVGGYIFQTLGFNKLLLIAGFIALIPIYFVRLLPEFRGGVEVSFTVSKKLLKFLIPSALIFMLMSQLGFGLITFYTTVTHFTVVQVSFLFMINGMMIVVLQDYIGKMLSNVRKFLPLGCIIYGVSYFAVAFITNFSEAAVDIIFITLAEIIVSPLVQAVATSFTEKRQRGKQIGVFGIFTSLGRVFGSSLASYLMTFFLYSPIVLWGLLSSLGFLSAILFFLALRTFKPAQSQVR
ncbi:MFS transporter [Stygiolobus caldivivus]|uniref:MFS transporter n=1 Tax=Stygiolobus caldivivus TaxID=2824673 RepID=A0A8D5ZGG8_9CREN|nr:MFS transporter [Stygiolobus caldivivus]BCU70918.1 MFS transporter [Stygiolobus caldivivus]